MKQDVTVMNFIRIVLDDDLGISESAYQALLKVFQENPHLKEIFGDRIDYCEGRYWLNDY